MKILVGVDDDLIFEDVLAALRWCVRTSPDDQVTLLHAKAAFPWMRRADADAAWSASVTEADERAARILTDGRQRLASWGIAAETLCVDDDAGKELLRVARERQADLIIVGARGRDQRGFLIGSVSQKVKALAETDVLVVRRGAPFDRPTFRVLLAVDGSPESLKAVEAFVPKMRADRAEVRVLHALDVAPRTVWNVFGEEVRDVDVSSLPPPLREQAERALSGVLALLRARGIVATTELCSGRPAEEILEAATRQRADLIVMGARGLTGLRGLLVGSVTQRVVRYGVTSVLVAR